MWLVVGLGNPGARYERNRHNVGFHVVDELVQRHGLPAWKTGGKLGGDTTTGVIVTPRGRERTTLLRPIEFMNLSGFAVQRTAKFHDVAIDKILVVHDELDLDFGIVRVKNGGGHGGHNGLRSMIEQLGGNSFARIRVGIGKPGPKPGTATGGHAPGSGAGGTSEKNIAGWVLADFPAAQKSIVDAVVAQSADAVESVIGLGVAPTMNAFNSKPSLS